MSQPLIALVMVLFAHSLFAQEPKPTDLKPVEQDATAEKAPPPKRLQRQPLLASSTFIASAVSLAPLSLRPFMSMTNK